MGKKSRRVRKERNRAVLVNEGRTQEECLTRKREAIQHLKVYLPGNFRAALPRLQRVRRRALLFRELPDRGLARAPGRVQVLPAWRWAHRNHGDGASGQLAADGPLVVFVRLPVTFLKTPSPPPRALHNSNVC